MYPDVVHFLYVFLPQMYEFQRELHVFLPCKITIIFVVLFIDTMFTKPLFLLLMGIFSLSPNAFTTDDKKVIAALDTEYQAAVKNNDAATMSRILADDFTLVVGTGKVYSKADLLKSARNKTIRYELQDDSAQTVRLWGNTAVITALLALKGVDTESGKSFDYQVWFSDTYVRTKAGWRYVFGQASIPLPKANSAK